MESLLTMIETKKERFYDLSPLGELLELFMPPGGYSRILRELHHNYMMMLIEDFMESDAIEHGKEISYTDSTLTELFYLKLLADCFDEIDKRNA